ncbi:flagellar M-ring protein FliF [Campylobacter sp. RM12327]|uniref:flagellar basal-body MS-ring/collar protein FliF n=1 Tax=Campylobacter sputorum TaxID=206 RepID=UPI00053BF62E|nr:MULTISPECIES: flagellar basal-body MS-ring/collar protein FliF [Campylobacter]ASM40562.1 flagellar MS-ring protein [Campylobacter sputorum]MBE7357773.1 flagellar M-ring protein FliF [Campylobacter sp. RM11302]MBF6669051.1 flagellar M-ring protein FliF [Campylobacter sp. RM12327]MBF6673940.1 flagellar M-ring protein FliF [Campylobacter sp. RM13538]MBF6675791.1 flagellar M-ring protein FliF [Campylobacter sp. RM12321]
MDFKAIVNQIGKLYQNLTLRQRIVAAGSIVVVIGFLVFLSIYKGSQSSNTYDGYSVLFENISPSDSALIIQQLNSDKVPYKLYNESTILVPNDKVYQERIAIASLGIPKDSKVGFEIFDKQQFGATDEEQRVKYQRALEGELARTIEGLAPIEAATVHIALPKDSVFTKRQIKPSASVLLNVKQNSKLTSKQISGIKNLIAASVPNLNAENVKLVDQDGTPLGIEEGVIDDELISKQIRYKKDFESSYERKIINVLSPIVGGDNKVVAKVTIDFDFAREDFQSEVYDPNSVARSEQNIEEKREGKAPKEVGGVPGAVSNIGPVEGLEDNQKTELYTKSSATTNYEISKKITKVLGEFATIKRVSVAVVVDGKYEYKKDENGNPTKEIEYVSLPQNELTAINNIVKQAVGYNQARGDEVTVSNFQFKEPTTTKTPANTIARFYELYLSPFTTLVKYLLAALVLYIFYKKIIVPFSEKMLEEQIEEYEPTKEDLGLMDIQEDTEDTLEKFKAAKQKVEEQLGLRDGNLNEEELKYDILLEKMQTIVSSKSEEIATLLQELVNNDGEIMSSISKDT